jgi:peptide-methionine (S)-S-oxide reductase
MKPFEKIYLAGGCLWAVQEFIRYLPGVMETEAGRANGKTQSLDGKYDGYVECVQTVFDPNQVSVSQLVKYLFEIIDPYSVNQQGPDVGEKYRTGIYSNNPNHLSEAQKFIETCQDSARIAFEILPLSNYIRSSNEHQDRLLRFPGEACHLPKELLYKYRKR